MCITKELDTCIYEICQAHQVFQRLPIIGHREKWYRSNFRTVIQSDRKEAKLEGGKTNISYTVKAININIYDKGHTVLSSIHLLMWFKSRKYWKITIVNPEHVK